MACGPGCDASMASATASIEDGVLRSNPSGPGVRSARTTARPSDGEPFRDGAGLRRPGARGETVQVEDHVVSFELPHGDHTQEGSTGEACARGDRGIWRHIHRRCQWT